MRIAKKTVAPQQLREICEEMFHEGRFLTMVVSDERTLLARGFVLRYVFARHDAPELMVAETVVDEMNPTYPSITPRSPAASWAEREALDLFGVRPLGHPDLRPLVLHEHWPDGVYPLRKEYPIEASPARDASKVWSYPKVEGAGVFEVPVGPIHAGVIEPGHFRFQVMGDSVLHLEAKLFYTHRGIEKRSEGMTLQDGLRLAEQTCGVCSVSHALSYAQAVENMAGMRISDRAAYLRVLFAELERLYNHVGDLGNLCAGVGFAYGSNHGARLKEMLMQLNGALSGHRFLRGTIALGGVGVDLKDTQLSLIRTTLREIALELEDIVGNILSHDIVKNRFATTGILTERVARDFSAVGPAARASHVDIDARRDLPYAAYPNLSFKVPVQTDGDVMARFQQRVLEFSESHGLIQQVIEGMPSGPVQAPMREVSPYQFGIGITESPRGENVHFVMSGENQTIYRYRIRSAAYANWPVVPYCVPGNIVPDFPLINKSFELCYACCDR